MLKSKLFKLFVLLVFLGLIKGFSTIYFPITDNQKIERVQRIVKQMNDNLPLESDDGMVFSHLRIVGRESLIFHYILPDYFDPEQHEFENENAHEIREGFRADPVLSKFLESPLRIVINHHDVKGNLVRSIAL